LKRVLFFLVATALVAPACHVFRKKPMVAPKRGEIVIAAWTEPRQLPRGGGPVQVLVRVQRVGGGAYPGVQVRLSTNAGKLFSAGAALVTDAQGMTRDRLTSDRPASLTVQIGDTRYRFKVAMASSSP
jgi:hypothetical protein